LATLEQTYYYSEKFPKVKYNGLGKTKIQASVCGFGTYRVDPVIQEHNEALEHAISNGINLIDTSSNYALGNSEILVGNVIDKLINNEVINRDQVVIITKGGYIQGELLSKLKKDEFLTDTYSECIKCDDDLWHCIHPDFLKDQITESLKRLQMDYVDFYLLHNPEYFLIYSTGLDINEVRDEYYRRIKQAFEYLEKEVKKGRISYYGISSNTLPKKPTSYDFTSLEKCIDIAEEISKDNHFAMIQFPLNLLEKEACKNFNQQAGTKNIIQLSKEKGIVAIANRPLNSIVDNKLFRLAEFSKKTNLNYDEIQLLIDGLKDFENNIKSKYIEPLKVDISLKSIISECFTLAKVLTPYYNQFLTVEQFKEIKNYFLIPRANYAISGLHKLYGYDQKLVHILDDYARKVNIILDSIDSILGNEHNLVLSKYTEYINKFILDKEKMTFSQKALLMINSIDGLSATLVGMRKVKYVDDVLLGLRHQPAQNVNEYWIN